MMMTDVSVETTIDVINIEFEHDHEYDVSCVGCAIHTENKDCSYLDANLCYQCPCLECLIKMKCKDGCLEFEKPFWKENNYKIRKENENKTL